MTNPRRFGAGAGPNVDHRERARCLKVANRLLSGCNAVVKFSREDFCWPQPLCRSRTGYRQQLSLRVVLVGRATWGQKTREANCCLQPPPARQPSAFDDQWKQLLRHHAKASDSARSRSSQSLGARIRHCGDLRVPPHQLKHGKEPCCSDPSKTKGKDSCAGCRASHGHGPRQSRSVTSGGQSIPSGFTTAGPGVRSACPFRSSVTPSAAFATLHSQFDPP